MTTAELEGKARPSRVSALLRQPLLWLALALALVAGLLSLPLSVAIGPMYWDTYLYIDAAQRIATGQIPSVDFIVPVGPLGYYLFAWGLDLFPHAQLTLMAQWGLLAVTAPLMAVVIGEVSRRNRTLAFAILIPFLIFAIFPSNVRYYHAFPGVDGFGIYNRHGVILLYVLTAGLAFLKAGRKLVWFCALAMLALFLTKITAFLAGGIIGLLALLAGRLKWTDVLLAGAIFAAPLVLAEFTTGFVSAYIGSIAELVGLNEGGILARFLGAGSSKLDVVLPLGIICVMLAWSVLSGGEKHLKFFDRSVWWLGVGIVAGTFYETQNTGSQEYIFVWPILLMIWGRLSNVPRKTQLVFLTVAAFATIPSVTAVAYKTLRSIVVMPTYERLDAPIVRNMQQVASRPEIVDMAKIWLDHFVDYPEAYAALAAKGHLPSWQYFSELDFQLFWVLEVARGAEALLAFEAENQIRLETLMVMDFTNPFPWILDRQATKHIQIGADPQRTIPPMSAETKAAIEATDGVLRAKCPSMPARVDIEKIYSAALVGRVVIALDPCWDLLLRPDLAPAQ